MGDISRGGGTRGLAEGTSPAQCNLELQAKMQRAQRVRQPADPGTLGPQSAHTGHECCRTQRTEAWP